MEIENQILAVIQQRLRLRMKHLNVAASRVSTESGFNHTFVKSIMEGTTPNVVNLARIARYLDVPVAYLIGEIDTPDPNHLAETARRPVYAEVATALQDLNDIDRMSIRALREVILDMPGARERLEDLERSADLIRQRLPKTASEAA